jgi:hypothetical protein
LCGAAVVRFHPNLERTPKSLSHHGTPHRMCHLGFVDFSLRQRRKQDRQPSDMCLERVARFAIACRTQVRRFGDFGLLMEVVGDDTNKASSA